MTFSILSMGGLLMVIRWIHFMAGITWIGLLYYFNFVQGASFAEMTAPAKTDATSKLVPRALWWFRWGAMVTIIAGFAYLGLAGSNFHSSWGVAILTGATLGTFMWFNVWFVIWPAQKVVIKSAQQVAAGGQAIPEAAARAARSTVASRTNTLFSIPLLFFMGAASHLGMTLGATTPLWHVAAVMGAIIVAIEFNALKGKTGPITTVKGVIHSGIALTVIMYVLMEILIK